MNPDQSHLTQQALGRVRWRGGLRCRICDAASPLRPAADDDGYCRPPLEADRCRDSHPMGRLASPFFPGA